MLSTAFFYARYAKGTEEITGFGMTNSVTLPSLAKNLFNKLRDENDDPNFTYNDEFMRHFVRQSIKGDRCVALNQWYKSTNSDKLFNIISKKLDIIGKICDILEKYFEYTNKQRKIKEDEYDS